ncbi:serine protease family S33, partial [Thraustotheca clavata]
MVADTHVYTQETCSKHYSCTSHVELSNGLNVEYARHGEANAPEKVLLIMGLHFEKESWLPIIATLLDDPTTYDPSRYELVSFDNRGVGGSDKPWELYSTSQMAQDALLLLDELKWPKAHIVGISMGGMISQELALLAPERVQSLTLMVTAPGFLRGPLPRLHQVAGYLHAGKNLLLPTRKSITNLLMFTLYPNDYLNQ